MPQEVLTLNGKIVLDEKGATIPLSNMRAEMKKAQIELNTIVEKFGPMSREAAKAATKVAELKDAIGDTADLVKAFNPDAKFNAFAGALSGVISGFSAMQGAMQLVGVESETLNKTIEKLQGVMQLADSINGVLAAKDAFKALGAQMKTIPAIQKLVTAGQRLWNLAMAANPIGAIVAVIALLIAGIVALTSYFMSNAEAAKKNAKEVKDSAKALDQLEKATARAGQQFDKAQSQQLALARAQGKSVEAIRELELKLADEKIAFEKASIATAENTLKIEKNRLEKLKLADADDEVLKAQQESVTKATELLATENADYTKALDEKVNIENKHIVEIAQINTQSNTDATQKAKQRAEEAKRKTEEANEKRKELTKQFAVDIKALEEQNYLNSIADESLRASEKLRIDYENEKLAITQKGFLKDEENKLIAQIDKKYKLDKAVLETEQKKKELEEAKKQEDYLAQLKSTFNDIRLNSIKDSTEKEIATIKQSYVDQYAEIEKNETYNADQKLNLKKALALREKQELDVIEANRKLEAVESNLDNYNAIIGDNEVKLSIRRQFLDKQDSYLKESLAKGIISQADFDKKMGESTKARISLGDLEKEAKDRQLAGIGNALSALSDMVGEQTGVGKALAVASTAISTYSTAQKAYESAFLPVPTLASPILGPIFAGIAVAQGLMSIKKILAVKVPGSSVNPSTPSMSSLTPPLPPQLNTQMINGSQVNQLASATARAYVVEADVSGGQERIQRLNRASRIN